DVAVTADGAAGEITLTLSKTEGITLRVVDGRDQRPLGAEVRVTDARGVSVYNNFFQTGEGAPQLNISVAPGTYEVRVEAVGYAPVSLAITAPSSRMVSLT